MESTPNHRVKKNTFAQFLDGTQKKVLWLAFCENNENKKRENFSNTVLAANCELVPSICTTNID